MSEKEQESHVISSVSTLCTRIIIHIWSTFMNLSFKDISYDGVTFTLAIKETNEEIF